MQQFHEESIQQGFGYRVWPGIFVRGNNKQGINLAHRQIVKYAKENIRINNIHNAEIFLGDVRGFRGGKFDRIIMPLAEGAIDYLDVAFAHAKRNTIIHLYGLSSDPLLRDFEEMTKQIAREYNFKIKILKKERVLPYAPGVLKVRFDLKVV